MPREIFDLHYTLNTVKAEDGPEKHEVFKPYADKDCEAIFSKGTKVKIWEEGMYYEGIITSGYKYETGEIEVEIEKSIKTGNDL